MNRKNLIIFFGAILFLIGACGLPSKAIPTITQPPTSQGSQPQPETATATTLPVETATSGTQTDVQKTFPIAPNSQFASPDTHDPSDPSGSFTIQSQSTINTVVKYYADELPTQGWNLRYTDANIKGGVTQYWKNDNIYLSLDFGFDEGQLTIEGQYDRVESKYAQKLPTDFPLPEQAEMVEAEESSWQFYIPQDYTDVTNFYIQKLSSMNWKLAPTPEPMEGGCGGTDCGGNNSFPTDAMPTATFDFRNSNDLSFTMPDGNVLELNIAPHQNGTIMYVDLTLKNIKSAGLPKDLPIYPCAVVQLITPGSAGFLVSTDMSTVENYYIDQMKAAGWTPNGTSYEDSNSFMEEWTKGDQTISIGLSTDGNNTDLSINCTGCTQ